MQLNKLFFCISLILCLGISYPQTYSITGKILDLQTNKPINNVSIYIEKFDVGTSSDSRGNFILLLNDFVENKVDLNIEIIGYNDKIIKLDLLKNKIALGEIFLQNESLELELIHVHSNKDKSKQISNIYLGGYHLNKNLKGNIANTLSNQSNIGINSFGAVISKPVVRGFSGDRFLLIKDGNDIGDLANSSIDHVITLDMSQVNNIELIRGPKSLIYGSNAIGGVINTTLAGGPQIRVDKIVRKISFIGESYNESLYGNFGLYLPMHKKQLNFLSTNSKSENQTTAIGELKNTYSKSSNYKIGLTHYNKNGYINFNFEIFNMDYGIPPFEIIGQYSGVDIELKKNTFQINYHSHLNTNTFNQLDVSYDYIDYQHAELSSNVIHVDLAKDTHNLNFEVKSSSSVIGIDIKYKHLYSQQELAHYFSPSTTQLNLFLYGYHEAELYNFDLLSSCRIGYLSIKPKDEIDYENLNADEIMNRKFNFFSSSIGVKKVFEKFEFNSWIMNTMRGPQSEELFSDGPHLGTYSYEVGKPDLDIEKIYGLESSLSYSTQFLSTSFTAFYNESPYYYQMSKRGNCDNISLQECSNQGYIVGGVGGPGYLYIYETEGVEASIKGLEFNIDYSYLDFQIQYEYSIVRGYNKTYNEPLSYINPDKQVLTLEYKRNFFNYMLRISNIESQDRLGEFETYTPSALIMDFILSFYLKKQNITIQLNNILDEEYYNHLSRIKDIYPEASRNFSINYKLFF